MPSMGRLHTPVMVYQPPLTPVSEADSDTTETGSTSNQSSSVTSSNKSYSQQRAINFSRPRPVEQSVAHRVYHDSTDSCSIISQSSPSRIKPQQVQQQDILAVSDDFWDTHLTDMKPHKRINDIEAQSSVPLLLLKSDSVQTPAEMPGSEPQPAQRPLKSAMRHKQMPQVLETEDEWEGEDVRSHHTASEAGDVETESSWSLPLYEPVTLSEKEIKKLRKRGIEPGLYAEMKAARKGKGKWINPLVGNTYLS